MASETDRAILASITGILAAVGQTDYDEFRRQVAKGAVLLGNLVAAADAVAKLSDEDLSTLIKGVQDPEKTLRLLEDLKEHLPKIGAKIVEGAQMVFPRSKGGKPTIFKDRESERELCKLVMAAIANGESEAKAKKTARSTLAKRKIAASMQTINRTWKRRAEILAEPSFEEFSGQLLRSWSVKPPDQSVQHTVPGDKLISGLK